MHSEDPLTSSILFTLQRKMLAFVSRVSVSTHLKKTLPPSLAFPIMLTEVSSNLKSWPSTLPSMPTEAFPLTSKSSGWDRRSTNNYYKEEKRKVKKSKSNNWRQYKWWRTFYHFWNWASSHSSNQQQRRLRLFRKLEPESLKSLALRLVFTWEKIYWSVSGNIQLN